MTIDEALCNIKQGYGIPHKHDTLTTIIEYVKQNEPCEDMINRKHLLSEIDDLMKSPWFNRYGDDCEALHFGYIERKEAVEIVRDLCVKTEPPVQPKTTAKWIPVSERLPRSHGVYQVTIQCEEGRYTSACYFDGSNTWHNDNRINHGRPYVTDKVIAWQEEPEPYKAESEK